MIVSHKCKFIFLKTRKTAGTSIEITLSGLCGSNDIITPIAQEDEKIRQKLGYRGPQNYHILNTDNTKDNQEFFNHATAKFIRENLGEAVWNSYFKFCFERNPFDKYISRYYWRTRNDKSPPEINDYIKLVPNHLLSCWNIYTINHQIAVDFVGHYETLSSDLNAIMNKLGFSTNLILPEAKGNYRSDKRHYSKILNKQARHHLELICANEIAELNYYWHESNE